MAEKENSAFRLYRFIQKMVPLPANAPTEQVLLDAFGVPKGRTGRDRNADLSKITFLLFNELELLVSELRRSCYSEEAIQSIAAPFDRLSAGGMSNQWTHNKEPFAATLNVLRAFGESLRNEEVAISEDDLLGLSSQVENLREEVEKSGLPGNVKQFIIEQLDIISRAIYEYPLAGVKAFKIAARDAIFHEAEHDEIAKDFADAPQMKGLKAIQTKVVEVAKFTIEFGKFLGAVESIYHHGGPALLTAGQHLSGWVKSLKP